MRTTFALDLNTALPQVLAQQRPDQSTRYLPGIGQQVGAAWQYLHTDALGSVRHFTGEDGNVAGSWRYSPFGQIEATNGDGSLFGYTGEPQDPSSGLTYLRARYYHPALGRFLTPDALVPDVLNGQAWNAYVYNDPINWVDPSGYAPWDGPVNRVREAAGNARRSMKDGFGLAKQWWNEKPDPCECGLDGGSGVADFLSRWGGPLGLQGAWGFFSSPAKWEAKSTIERLHYMGWRKGWRPKKPSNWFKWIPEGEPTYGPVKVHGFQSPTDGIHYAHPFKRVRLTQSHFAGPVLRGAKGFFGTIFIGALIDGLVQFGSDWLRNPCDFSPSEFARRARIATLYGLPTAFLGAVTFTFALSLGAPSLVAATIGVGASYAGGLILNARKEEALNRIP
ncbi:MAG: hypothetical protein GFH27_549305n214 [Chloroflexi bacterium AL-W]|nr:hypothetical protein [Chloroflexi bacterium AL-N1]NOK71232.1 hypothetical protein [Chloroflexi bacterium AL-N10]NOK76521.1 hypothetical protein [Chloroflexi bacterium AL-N5]NOK83638.1 hypothetical protein [Chloroflexi bacterium AL-W]NOK92240.1 hypothetical protein [Chloroflexi bacterium AL-N15]